MQIDADTKKRSRRPKGFLVAVSVESEEWQLRELKAAIAELDSGRHVSHEKVSKWLKSWGKPGQEYPVP